MTRFPTLLLLAACVPEPEVPTTTPDRFDLVMATTADDYQVGALTVLDTEAPAPTDIATLHGDAVVVTEGTDLFAINRLLADTIRRYDGSDLEVPLWEVSVGRGANPHDVATCAGALWVSRYEETELHVLDRDTGALLTTVDLADQADDDGIPEMSDLVVMGDRLLVGLQRLRRQAGWVPDEGRIAVIDCATRTLVDTWSVGPNPVLRANPLDPASVLVLHDEGVDAVTEGSPEPLWDGRLVDLDVRPGAVVSIARAGSDHTIRCATELGGDWTLGETRASYMADVLLHGDAWIANRRGWEDPSVAGGLLRLDPTSCTVIETIEPTLAPYSLAALTPE